MKKTMMFLVAAIFLMSSVCLGAKVDLAKVAVPRDSGRIVETYVSPKADAPVIAYVQDIHVNYEAQKAEANIVEALVKDYGFDLVMLEGRDQGNTADLKKYRSETPAVRQQAGEDLLSKGSIYGAEYLDLVSDLNFTMVGIEDMSLYKAETQDHAALIGKSDEMTKLIATLSNIANNLKLHIYTKEMRDLDDKITAYDKDEIGLIEYAKFIETAAKANNIDVNTMPNLSLFIDSANLEGQINFPAVETERQTVFTAIEKALTGKAKEDLTAANLKFRTGDMTQAQFYTYLKDTAEVAKVDLTPNKNLVLYTKYIITYEKIDTTVLFKEIGQLVDKMKTAMTKTPEQTKLSQIDKGLSILADFANTKLIPDEYNYYVQHKAEFNLKGWLAFLKTNSVNFKLTNPVPDDVSVIETNMPVLERFYSNSLDRDRVFIQNIAANLQKFGKDKAILVTGGFHTANMKKLLRDNGYSYVIIAPRVDVIKDYSNIYKERMKIDLDYANKAVPSVSPASAANKANRQAVSDVIAAPGNVQAAIDRFRGLEGQGQPAQIRDAVVAELQSRLAGATPAQTVWINEVTDAYRQSSLGRPHGDATGRWVGGELDAARAQKINTRAQAVQPQQIPAVLRGQILGGMAVGLRGANPALTADQARQEAARLLGTFEVRVLANEADMEGEIGPVLIGRTVVMSQRDWNLYQNFGSVLAHEFTEAACLLNGMTAEQAHGMAEAVEVQVRADAMTSNPRELAANRMSDGVARGIQVRRSLGAGTGFVQLDVSSDLRASHPEVVNSYQVLLEAMYGQGNVKIGTARGSNQINLKRYTDNKKTNLLGESNVTANRSASGETNSRIGGLLELAHIGSYVPPMQAGENPVAYQQANAGVLAAFGEQFRAVTGNNLALLATPSQWPPDFVNNEIRRIVITLPAPTPWDVNDEMENEIARQVFRKAA
ncbi:MAG: hypothetical protein WC658_03515 [Candidatus Omnitrophota bacterium]